MKALAIVALVAGLAGTASTQEKPVPKDSIRISIPGCSKGVVFTVVESPEHESRSSVAPGRRFRLAGPKKLLEEIKAWEGAVIEVTGLIRKGQLDERGVAVGGGVRIGPGPSPMSGAGRNPNFNQIVLDVEGWRGLTGACPSR
ncbi:MAG: hypothetical protein IT180_09195 [Acidobacteria bacterium]|nr:hypothetical protein [Acidobacteriota bacterium]